MRLVDAYLDGSESTEDPGRLESLQTLAQRAIARPAWLRALTQGTHRSLRERKSDSYPIG